MCERTKTEFNANNIYQPTFFSGLITSVSMTDPITTFSGVFTVAAGVSFWGDFLGVLGSSFKDSTLTVSSG